jgi:signal transduction histidine kinase
MNWLKEQFWHTSWRQDIARVLIVIGLLFFIAGVWEFFYTPTPGRISEPELLLFLLMVMLATGFTLFMSSRAALFVQASLIIAVVWVGRFSLLVEGFIVLFIIISAVLVHKLKVQSYTLFMHTQHKERELAEAMQNLKKVDELKDEVIFVASHDLRTPLSIIKSNLASIQEGYAGNVNKEARTYISAAYRASERLGDLLEDLLEASVVEHKDQINLEAVQIEEIIEAVAAAHKKETTHLVVKMPKKPYKTAKVHADRIMLQRAIENVFLNAAKYTKKGSIVVSVQVQGKHVCCTIQDTGIGIDHDSLDRLFTKFYRAPNAVNAQSRGTGLGLYITKQIIQKLRGTLTVESKLDQGSIFTICLPKVNE